MSPAERVVFVLHDVFEFPFEKIAPMVKRSPAACRQLASRARRQINEEAASPRFAIDPTVQRRGPGAVIAGCPRGGTAGPLPLLGPFLGGVAGLGGVPPPGSQPHVRR